MACRERRRRRELREVNDSGGVKRERGEINEEKLEVKEMKVEVSWRGSYGRPFWLKAAAAPPRARL